jgi:hypothetical protein
LGESVTEGEEGRRRLAAVSERPRRGAVDSSHNQRQKPETLWAETIDRESNGRPPAYVDTLSDQRIGKWS